MRSSTWLLPLLLLSSSTSGASGQCAEEIMVRRNQVLVAQEGEQLEVECPVSFCSDPPPRVSWVKYTNGSDKDKPGSVLESRWEGLSNSSGVSYLTFTHLLLNHSGEYRCETNFTKGHIINITVTGSAEVSVEEDDDRRADRGGPAQLQPYLWASAGVLLCVVVVVTLSVVSLQRCPGDPRRMAEYQNTVVPMTQYPSAHSNPGQAPPSDTPLSLARPHRPAPSPPTAHRTSQHGRLYGNRGEKEAEEEEEEDQSIWYAALNHDVMPVAPRVRRRDSLQDVEYAAIHVA
ncbi:B- and T-lymphocyte attenuator-like isoform X1 [Gadus chalcogrammus]|uniref:B- and T-lymphocyte attenuator-like isoform X1 n=1 Tax=Gadus chalcogrammus TaxID=1042646 RepID=UPI0024C27DBF|nr:B- and T-lymphocyte attenuator-like isoform X1 [Gadus chalcogrammus]